MRKYKLELGGKNNRDFPPISDLVDYTILWISNPGTGFRNPCSCFFTPKRTNELKHPSDNTIRPHSSSPYHFDTYNTETDPIILPLVLQIYRFFRYGK